MHPVKRPKSTDTEEDLLKEEEEFLKSLKSQKVQPAAKVVKVKKTNDSDSGLSSVTDGNEEDKMEVEGGDDEEGEGGGGGGGILLEHPMEAVLLSVKERAFDASKLQGFSGLKAPPEVVKVKLNGDDHDKSGAGVEPGSRRKKSLFARSFDARQESRRKARGQNVGSTSTSQTASVEGQNSSQSTTEKLTGSAGAAAAISTPSSGNSGPIGDKVHPLLAGMTEEDILLEQKKLLERLDPKLVDFIRKRSQSRTSATGATGSWNAADPIPAKSAKQDSHQPETASQPMEVTPDEIPANTLQITEDDLPIDPKSVKNYPGMNKVELSKLAWAGVINDPQPLLENQKKSATSPESKSKSARFDFTGLLLPDNKSEDPSTYDKALHHHGEEMERPGYTIEELLTLARSVNFQQRSIALDTLGNIYARAHTGIYDEFLEQSLFQLLDYMDFIHVVRKGLDNNDSNSINSSLGCLAALLYVEHEEACLDATYLWPNTRPFPILSTKPDELKKDRDPTGSEMKDSEFLQLDLLDFLINRTEVLTRVEYLLMTKSDLFNEKGVTSLLKVLIRLARHSPYAVMQHERMLKYVVEHHISPNWITLRERQTTLKGIPLIHALKLMRILIESSAVNAMKIYQNYRILPSVMSYLAYDQWREQSHVEEVEDLVLESFKIWLSFLSLGIAIDEYISFFPVIMQFLQFYGVSDKLNSFDLLHSAHLFALLSQIICFGEQSKTDKKNNHSHWDLVKDATSLIEQHCYRITKIISAQHLQGTFNIDLSLLSLGKGLEFLTLTTKYSDQANLSNRFLPVVREFVNCSMYSSLTASLISHSVILEKSSTKSRYPSNFANIGGIRWEGKLNPVMKSNSPFHFLNYFVSFSKRVCDSTCSVCDIIFNDNIGNYLLTLQRHQTNDETEEQKDYFIRFELSCLFEILDILPKESVTRFPVAYKGLAQVPSCSVELFRNFLKCSLDSCCKPSDLNAVYDFYLAYFGLPTESPENSEETPDKKATKVRFDDGGHPGDDRMEDSKVLFEKWSLPRTEEHWMFHPLESLYKRATGTPGYLKDNLETLGQETRGCLSFIQHCLRHYCQSIVQTSQDLVTVYCRLCRVFMLGSPDIYFDKVTAPILQGILQILINGKVLSSNPSKSVFSKYKPTASAAVSFYDFYNEFVTEYFDNSYFNETFAAYCLLPLRSAEDDRVKTCFWSHEHLHCIRLSEEKIPISIEYLTKCPEKDPQMLSIFTGLIKRMVLTKERNPFLYDVTVSHLRNSLEYMTEDLRSDFNMLKL